MTVMPPGTIVEAICPHGTSNWSTTAKIQTSLDGDPLRYFVKVTQNKFGRKMFEGEHESAKAIYTTYLGLCARPIAWGAYKTNPNTHFILFEFLNMINKLSEMHTKALAPDGMYGFHVQTMTGLLPQYVTELASWEEFFTGYMHHFIKAERLAQGPPNDELTRLQNVFLDRIIPRLCRPLETGGRVSEPRLLHADHCESLQSRIPNSLTG